MSDDNPRAASDSPASSQEEEQDMERQKPTPGRIVHYRLTEDDVMRIASQRGTAQSSAKGNGHAAGEYVPLLVVRIWPDEYGPGIEGINGQAFLDGNDALWVTSAKEGDGNGQWCWPPRA